MLKYFNKFLQNSTLNKSMYVLTTFASLRTLGLHAKFLDIEIYFPC